MKSIERVINENPELYTGGWYIPEWGARSGSRDEMLSLDFREQVAQSLVFLTERCRLTQGSSRKRGSYGLKHLAENHRRYFYVSNGAFIVAALMLGYTARRHPGSPNCGFNFRVLEDREEYQAHRSRGTVLAGPAA